MNNAEQNASFEMLRPVDEDLLVGIRSVIHRFHRKLWRIFKWSSWLIGCGTVWVLFKVCGFDFPVVMLTIVGWGLAVGLAAMVLRAFELRVIRRAICTAEGQSVFPEWWQGWLGCAVSLVVMLAAAGGLGVASDLMGYANEQRELWAVIKDPGTLMHSVPERYRGVPCDQVPILTAATPSEINEIREGLNRVYESKGITGRVETLEVLGEVPEMLGAYRVKATFSEPLYGATALYNLWIDEATEQTFRVKANWREVKRIAEPGTEVYCVLSRGNTNYWCVLKAEGLEDSTFVSGFKLYNNAAVIDQTSEVYRQWCAILSRALAVQEQIAADKAIRREETLASARYQQNSRTLNEVSDALKEFLQKHYGKLVTALPEDWSVNANFGILPGESLQESITVDTSALLADLNRRIVIGGYSIKLATLEVLDMVESKKQNHYTVRVTADQPVYSLSDRYTRKIDPNNPNIDVSGLPAWREVSVRHAAGEPFVLALTMSTNPKKPDGFSFDEKDVPGIKLHDEVIAKGKNCLLIVENSQASRDWAKMCERAFALEQALYEDEKLRKSDKAAKKRYASNKDKMKSFKKTLEKYVKDHHGKIVERLPWLPMPDAPTL